MPYPSLPGHRPPESLRPADPAPMATPRPAPAPAAPEPAQPQPITQASTRHTAKIHSWDHRKGYGFLNHGQKRLFLHRRDFAEHHKKPKRGDLIHFEMGKDSQGRKCAVRAAHCNDGGSLTFPAIALLATLLILPGFALYQFYQAHSELAPWILNAILIVNILSYYQYAADKKRARSKDWRVRESTLHFLELVGGWPGAFIAQRRLRHKCSKLSYQFIFWLIVVAYQCLALGYILDWKMVPPYSF